MGTLQPAQQARKRTVVQTTRTRLLFVIQQRHVKQTNRIQTQRTQLGKVTAVAFKRTQTISPSVVLTTAKIVSEYADQLPTNTTAQSAPGTHHTQAQINPIPTGTGNSSAQNHPQHPAIAIPANLAAAKLTPTQVGLLEQSAQTINRHLQFHSGKASIITPPAATQADPKLPANPAPLDRTATTQSPQSQALILTPTTPTPTHQPEKITLRRNIIFITPRTIKLTTQPTPRTVSTSLPEPKQRLQKHHRTTQTGKQLTTTHRRNTN